MKIDFTGNFKGLNGNDLKNENDNLIEISSFVANRIASMKTKEPIRTIELCRSILNKKKVELNKSDIDYLKEYVMKLEVSDIITAQILEILNAEK